jgi:predicted transcriptional regulator
MEHELDDDLMPTVDELAELENGYARQIADEAIDDPDSEAEDDGNDWRTAV